MSSESKLDTITRLMSPVKPHESDGEGTTVSIKIEKIGLKEATQYLDPFISVKLVDANGKEVEESIDTPVANKKHENYIDFDYKLDFKTPKESFPKGGAIFFEFKHFKPKPEKISTKAWSFMEMDELKSGTAILEM